MTTDRRAVEADLVREHLPLTSRAVNELSRRLPAHVHGDDLLSAAMLGLAQAARSWDPEHGASDELRGSDWASRSVRSRARRMARASDELTMRLGRAPTPTRVAAELGTDTAAVHKLTDDLYRARWSTTSRSWPRGTPTTCCPAATTGPTSSWSTGSGAPT